MELAVRTLLVDAGNTRVKWCIVSEGTIIETGESAVESPEKLPIRQPFDKAIVATVSIPFHQWEEWFKKIHKPYQLVTAQAAFPYQIAVDSATIGVDRLLAVAGAQQLYPATNCLVITCGTCITYNVLTADGRFMGGAISPGIAMRLKAMHAFTAQLPEATLTANIEYPATHTLAALNAGALLGAAFEVDGFITSTIQNRNDFSTLITGGDALLLVPYLKNKIFAHENLILTGLEALAQTHF